MDILIRNRCHHNYNEHSHCHANGRIPGAQNVWPKKGINHRKKVIVIPFARHYNSIKVMLVKDKRSGDYAFLSGGVKANESVMQAAMRELNEETYGAMSESDIIGSPYIKQLNFTNSFRPQHRDESIEIRKKFGEHYPNGITELCHIIVFEVPHEKIENVLFSYHESFKSIQTRKDMDQCIETTNVIFEDIKSVTKWERDQMRGRCCSPDANGIHLWDVHVKNGLAMRVRTALMGA